VTASCSSLRGVNGYDKLEDIGSQQGLATMRSS
jgi:hypothetical protein